MEHNDYLFYVAEYEDILGNECITKEEAIQNFKSQYKRIPERIIGITKVNGNGMCGNVVWEDMEFLNRLHC